MTRESNIFNLRSSSTNGDLGDDTVATDTSHGASGAIGGEGRRRSGERKDGKGELHGCKEQEWKL